MSVPDESHQRWLRLIGIARLGVLSFITIGAAFMDVPAGLVYLLLMYLFGFTTNAWYLHTIHHRPQLGKYQATAQVLVDFSVVAVTVALTDGPTSFFTFMFVVVILEAGLLLGFLQGFLLATLATMFMIGQHLMHPYRDTTISSFVLWYNFTVQGLAYYLTAFISGHWTHRLYQLQKFQREILDNMNSGFLITDVSGNIKIQNKAAASILGLQSESAVGQYIGEILQPESGEECPVITALRSDQDFTRYEFTAILPQGQSVLLGLTTNRMTDTQGEPMGSIVSFSDLTEMDEMRQELRRQDRMAIVGELAAGLAHEIRNPVAVIRGAMDELTAENMTPGLQEKLHQMALRESDQLNEIVSGFLNFAREPLPQRKKVNVTELLEEVCDLLRREYGHHTGLTISNKGDGATHHVAGDPSQLKQVFINIGKNGIEAMDFKGILTISTQLSEDGPLAIQFDDDGSGVDPDKVGRIFEPFYTTKERGVGMGLAVCLRIITAHDGIIRARTRQGSGCSMLIRLPAMNVEQYKEAVS